MITIRYGFFPFFFPDQDDAAAKPVIFGGFALRLADGWKAG
jgi:hypothetical protein